MPLPLPILLAGPTATGKSEIALALAKRLGGEIISVDSMQVYRGMNIGTAKPSTAQRNEIPHHLIDVVDINQSFDAAQFVRQARQAVLEIQSRDRVPILCGGTGLYFKAFLDGLGQTPPANPELRTQLAALPLPELLDELAQKDPETYARIDRHNPRRIIRALEVIRLTGKPYSSLRADWGRAAENPEIRPRAFGLTRSASDVRRRIDKRVEAMFRSGLVAETERLLRQGLDENPTALQALGYRQVVEHLRGQRPLAETIELIKIRTHQFAKRQLTWFRRQVALNWITLDEGASSETVAQALAGRLGV